MNEHKSRADLIKIVSEKSLQDESIVELFVDQFFFELNQSIKDNSSVTVEGLGTLRIIRSNIQVSKDLARSGRFDQKKTEFPSTKKSSLIDKDILENKVSPKLTNDNLGDINNTKKDSNSIGFKISEIHDSTTNISTTTSDTLDKRNDSDKASLRKKRISPYARDIKNVGSSNTENTKQLHVSTTNKIAEDKVKEENITRAPDKSKLETIFNNIENKDEEFDDQIISDNNISQRKHKKSLSSIIIAVIIGILSFSILAFIVYLILFDTPPKEKYPYYEVKIDTTHIYKELQVYDSTKYSFVVMPNVDIPIENVAEYYYGDKAFWPYIYYANNDFIYENFIFLAGSIIKIPKLKIDLVEYRKGTIQENAEKLGETIKKSNSNF